MKGDGDGTVNIRSLKVTKCDCNDDQDGVHDFHDDNVDDRFLLNS